VLHCIFVVFAAHLLAVDGQELRLLARHHLRSTKVTQKTSTEEKKKHPDKPQI